MTPDANAPPHSKWADEADEYAAIDTGLAPSVAEPVPANPVPVNPVPANPVPNLDPVQDANPVTDPVLPAAEPVVAKVDPPIEIIPAKSEVVRDGDDHDAFVKQLMESRSAPIPEPPPPPAPTPRQWSATQEEMRRGAERVAYNEAQKINRPQPVPEPNQPTNIPVFRPHEYTHESDPSKVIK